MIDAIRIGVVENTDLPSTGGTVAGAAGLLSTILGFDIVGPYQIEYSRVRLDFPGVAEHILFHILIELQEFRFLPVFPIVLVL